MKTLVHSVVHIVQSRLELFEAECRLERSRLSQLFTSLGLACGSILLAGAAGMSAVVLAIPENFRVLALAIFALLASAIAGACIYWALRISEQNESPFSATKSELRKDVECIRSVITNKK